MSSTIYAVNESEFINQFQKAHRYDGGYDILTNQSATIPPRGKAVLTTGLKIAIPMGYVGIIKSRSGLALKHDLEHGAGVVDSGYTGEILVILRNNSDIEYKVDAGDKVAQLLVVPIANAETCWVQELPDTPRGENGFNSTGY